MGAVKTLETPERISTPSDYERWFPPRSQLSAELNERAEQLQLAFERFTMEAVQTIDEHDTENSRKPLPLYGQMAYLRYPIQLLMRSRTVYWLKSRKVSATWLILIYLLWDVLYHRDRLNGWVTQKEEDGKHLLDRYLVRGLVPSLPRWLHRLYRFRPRAGSNLIVDSFQGKPWGSSILAYPKGADQLRQFAHSKVVVDEAHLLPDLADLLQGISPGLRAREGAEGGQLILIFVARKGAHVKTLCGPLLQAATKLALERLTPITE